MKVVNLVLTAIFCVFAALQFNDPDPWAWAIMYFFVAAVCAWSAFRPVNRLILWAGPGVCLIWMFTLLPEFVDWIEIGAPNIATGMKAETPYVEFTREFLGLAICLATLGWQLWRNRKKHVTNHN